MMWEMNNQKTTKQTKKQKGFYFTVLYLYFFPFKLNIKGQNIFMRKKT